MTAMRQPAGLYSGPYKRGRYGRSTRGGRPIRQAGPPPAIQPSCFARNGMGDAGLRSMAHRGGPWASLLVSAGFRPASPFG